MNVLRHNNVVMHVRGPNPKPEQIVVQRAVVPVVVLRLLLEVKGYGSPGCIELQYRPVTSYKYGSKSRALSMVSFVHGIEGSRRYIMQLRMGQERAKTGPRSLDGLRRRPSLQKAEHPFHEP